jgi:hypothetical protein
MGLSEGKGSEREAADLAERAIGKAKKRGRKDAVVGRQDKDGQEAAIDLTALKKGMPKAIKLEKDLADSRSDASAFYKKFAKECGLNTAQLKAAAKAYADEEIEAQRRKAEQMTLIFEQCGA